MNKGLCRKCSGEGTVPRKNGKGRIPCPVCQGKRKGHATK